MEKGSGAVFGDGLKGLNELGNVLDGSGEGGFSGLDRRDRFVVSYNYDLPVARLFHGHGPSKLVNGWAVNGVTTFQSGTPINVFDGSVAPLQDTDGVNFTNFATLAPGATLGSAITSAGTTSRLGTFINPAAFRNGVLADGTIPNPDLCVNNQNVTVACSDPTSTGFALFGNVGRNAFRGPFQQYWDLSIIKNTKVTEATSVDFRSEFFNTFNHPA